MSGNAKTRKSTDATDRPTDEPTDPPKSRVAKQERKKNKNWRLTKQLSRLKWSGMREGKKMNKSKEKKKGGCFKCITIKKLCVSDQSYQSTWAVDRECNNVAKIAEVFIVAKFFICCKL